MMNASIQAVSEQSLTSAITDVNATFEEIINSIHLPSLIPLTSTCSICKSKYHNRLKCPLRNVTGTVTVEARVASVLDSIQNTRLPEPVPRNKCSICKMQGHNRRSCPQLPHYYTDQIQEHVVAPPLAANPPHVRCPRSCSNCGLPGHFKPKCPFPPKSRVLPDHAQDTRNLRTLFHELPVIVDPFQQITNGQNEPC